MGWHLCRAKLPRKVVNSKTKFLTKSETNNLKNAPKCPRKTLSPVQLPKSFLLELFHSFAPAISNAISNFFSHRESAGVATLALTMVPRVVGVPLPTLMARMVCRQPPVLLLDEAFRVASHQILHLMHTSFRELLRLRGVGMNPSFF